MHDELNSKSRLGALGPLNHITSLSTPFQSLIDCRADFIPMHAGYPFLHNLIDRRDLKTGVGIDVAPWHLVAYPGLKKKRGFDPCLRILFII